jgi:hypothetical protein
MSVEITTGFQTALITVESGAQAHVKRIFDTDITDGERMVEIDIDSDYVWDADDLRELAKGLIEIAKELDKSK